MRIYIHKEEQLEPELVEVDDATTVRDAVAQAVEDVEVVFIEDEEEEVDLTLALSAAPIADRGHVFAGKRRRVEVEVQFNGAVETKRFVASARVRRVFKWATGKKVFDLSQADAAEHTLALCASGEIPPEDAHLGSLRTDKPGELCFNLIPKHRFEG